MKAAIHYPITASPDAPVCSLSEPVVYGVGMGEMMDIFCDVVANPYTLEFAWSFNNSADFLDVPKSRVKIINGTRSKFTHTPTNNKEYGTFMCTATNEVGRQRVPCVFHIILAGELYTYKRALTDGKGELRVPHVPIRSSVCEQSILLGLGVTSLDFTCFYFDRT